MVKRLLFLLICVLLLLGNVYAQSNNPSFYRYNKTQFDDDMPNIRDIEKLRVEVSSLQREVNELKYEIFLLKSKVSYLMSKISRLEEKR